LCSDKLIDEKKLSTQVRELLLALSSLGIVDDVLADMLAVYPELLATLPRERMLAVTLQLSDFFTKAQV
jgi:hypothetical protein